MEADRASGRIKAENSEKGRAQGDATGGSVVGGGYGRGHNLTKTGEQERKEGEEGPMPWQALPARFPFLSSLESIISRFIHFPSLRIELPLRSV